MVRVGALRIGTSDDWRGYKPTRLQAALLTLATVAVGVLVPYALRGPLGGVHFTVPVALMALLGMAVGTRHALVATLLTAVGLWFVFTAHGEPYAEARLLIYAGAGVLLSVVGGQQREARARARRSALASEQSRKELEAVISAVSEGIVVLDAEGRFLMVNEAEARLSGFPGASEMYRELSYFQQLFDIADLEGRPLAPEEWPVARMVRGERLQDIEVTATRRDTGQRWIYSLSGGPIPGATGAARAVVSTRDITAHKQAERALAEGASLVRAIQATVPDLVYAKDREGRYLMANPATLEALGLEEREIIGHTDRELLPEDIARELAANDQRIMESGRHAIVEEVVPVRGELRTWSSSKSPYCDADGRVIGLLGITRDITARKEMEDALRDSESRFRGAVENLPEVVVLFDHDRRIAYLNSEAVRLAGHARGALVGRRLEELWGAHLTDAWGPSLDRAFAGERLSFEYTGPLLGCGPATWQQSFVPVAGAEGLVDEVLCIARDVTEERRLLGALREASQRKDEFLALLSHELRNPMAPIRNSVFVLERAEPDSEAARRARAILDRQVSHLARLVDDLLDVTRISRGKIQLRLDRLDLAQVIRASTDDHRAGFEGAGISLIVRVPEGPVWVDGDPTRLAQVVGNLMSNAAKFTPRGGRTEVSLDVADGKARVRVQDTGPGIPPELRDQIFEPFVQADKTLARTPGGLGLGLALVKGLVSLHDGTVIVRDADPGPGACFEVMLPLAGARSPTTG